MTEKNSEKPADKSNIQYVIRKAKKGKTEGEVFWSDVGTLLIRGSLKNGVLFLNHLDGDFAVFAKDGEAKKEGVYAIRHAKKGKVEGEVFWADVGTAVIREGGKNGVLFLNHLDGDFALFLKDAEKKKEAAPVAEAA